MWKTALLSDQTQDKESNGEKLTEEQYVAGVESEKKSWVWVAREADRQRDEKDGKLFQVVLDNMVSTKKRRTTLYKMEIFEN